MKRLAIPMFFLFALSAYAEERAIVKEVVVKASPETAWKTWTTVEGIKSFFAPDARIEPRPDGPFEVYFNPYAPPGLKGADDMRFLALQEPRLVSFTWNAPPQFPEVRPQRTSVTLRFKPVGEGQTQVTLHHSGWGDGGQWDQNFDYFNNAWGRVLAQFKKRFEDGPMDWTEYSKRMKAMSEQGLVKEGVPATVPNRRP